MSTDSSRMMFSTIDTVGASSTADHSEHKRKDRFGRSIIQYSNDFHFLAGQSPLR